MKILIELFKTDPIGVYVCIMSIIPIIAVSFLAVRYALKKHRIKKAVTLLWRIK